MHGWFLIQTFYHGLKRTSREHLDAAAGGAFFLLLSRFKYQLLKNSSRRWWKIEVGMEIVSNPVPVVYTK
jgi:hypothetical protein